MEINTLIAILAALLLMLLGLYVFKSKDSSSSENKKPRRRADIPNRDEDGQIIQGNLFTLLKIPGALLSKRSAPGFLSRFHRRFFAQN